MTADQTLLNRLRDGDASAFEQFLREKFDLLYAFVACRIQDAEQAEEIVLDTLRAAIKGIRDYNGDGSLSSWLLGIARNKLADSLRKTSRPTSLRRALWLDTEAIPSKEVDPVRSLLEGEQRRLVVQILSDLPDHYSRALRLQYWENRSVEDVGADLGVTQKAAEMILRRAREEFRRQYERYSVEEASGGTP